MKNIKIKILFLLVFILLNGTMYVSTELNKEQRVQVVLDESLKNLQINYEILLHNQKLIADAAYVSTTELTRGFTKILKAAQNASFEKKNTLRQMLEKLLKPRYALLRQQGVLQYQFVLPNNESFLRMHRPNQYGDNLAKYREDIRYVNETHKPLRGFYKGKNTHAFRNIYPIFDSRSNYLGAVEISFSANSVETFLSTKVKAYKYFLVKKNVFDATQWHNGTVLLDYIDNGEKTTDMMLTLNKSHTKNECIIQNEMKLESVRKRIEKAIQNNNGFAVHALRDVDHVDVVAFYPITNNVSDEALGWIVSQGRSSFIYETEKNTFIIRIAFALVTFILMILLYKLIVTKQEVEREHTLVNDVLNSGDNIIFATNFRDVNFSNKNFLKFFNVKNNTKFNKKTKHDLVSIFMPVAGSLHSGLLKEKENFLDLVERTPKEGRVVSILDDALNTKEFTITVSKTSYSDKNIFLVSLSDMAKIKEIEENIQKKAFTDTLTGLYNKNKFDEVVKNELKRDARHKRDLGIALVNINNYQSILDTHGNLIADGVVLLLAQTLKENLRETDMFARFNDGEFAIAFLDTSKEDVESACKKLQNAIDSLTHPIAGKLDVTFATTQHLEADTVETMYSRCDAAFNKINDTIKNTLNI